MGIFRYANFGLTQYSVLLTGILQTFHTSFAITANVMCARASCVCLEAEKKSLVGLSTLMNLLLYGAMTDAVLSALRSICEAPSLGVRIICLAGALFLLSFSGAMYYTADLGVSTCDAIA